MREQTYIYLVDVGVLIHKGEHEFEDYSGVYNHQYGFYDEDQWYVRSEQEAIQIAKEYVNDGVENTYAVVSQEAIDDDFDEDLEELEPSYHEYIMDSVIYSAAKMDSKIVEHFLKVYKEAIQC